MGRQWLHAKREVASLKKSKTTSKYVREITLAARQGADPALNARLATALDRARKESVAKDVIQRAIEKGSGAGAGKDSLEHMVFEGKSLLATARPARRMPSGPRPRPGGRRRGLPKPEERFPPRPVARL